MNRSVSLLAAACLLCLSPGAMAGEHEGKAIERQLQCVRCATTPCCCPSVYCRKPFPCLPCLSFCGKADDYCRKPLPCIPCPAPACCPNDYCRKPLPDLCCPPPTACPRLPQVGSGK